MQSFGLMMGILPGNSSILMQRRKDAKNANTVSLLHHTRILPESGYVSGGRCVGARADSQFLENALALIAALRYKASRKGAKRKSLWVFA
jgi:hypothetical protein